MTDKSSDHEHMVDGGDEQPEDRRARLRRLHGHSHHGPNKFAGLPADQLPPASTSNAARQARSRLNMTFPLNWKKPASAPNVDPEDPVGPNDLEPRSD